MSTKKFRYYPNDYKTIKVLGKGAFGETRLIEDRRTGQKFVSKDLRASATKEFSPTSEVDFRNEVNILQGLRDKCEDLLCYISNRKDPRGDKFEIITEYLDEYIPLDEYIKEADDYQRWNDFRTKFLNMTKGLKTIHDSGIAHRDIKPGNIMINPKTGHTKIIDFGVSCTRDECHGIAGTPLYMPPETKYGVMPDFMPFEMYKRGDIWELGVTLLELILGKRFIQELYRNRKTTMMDLMDYIPDEFRNDYPDVVDAITRMLSIEYHDRELPEWRFI